MKELLYMHSVQLLGISGLVSVCVGKIILSEN